MKPRLHMYLSIFFRPKLIFLGISRRTYFISVLLRNQKNIKRVLKIEILGKSSYKLINMMIIGSKEWKNK